MKNIFIAFLMLSILCLGAQAKIMTKTVEYSDGDTILQGYLAWDSSMKKPTPAVLIFHEWWGINKYVEKRARQIASLGYIAFCGDIYGKGVRPKNEEEAGKQAGIYREDRKLMVKRAELALDTLKKQKNVNSKKIAAIGYCFGGGVALELARTGADVVGVVSFHGNLDTMTPASAESFKPVVLVFQGGDDPYVTREAIEKLQDEMNAAKADWTTTIYGGAVHGFTNPANGTDASKGLAYNKKADMRSWNAFFKFLREIFGKK